MYRAEARTEDGASVARQFASRLRGEGAFGRFLEDVRRSQRAKHAAQGVRVGVDGAGEVVDVHRAVREPVGNSEFGRDPDATQQLQAIDLIEHHRFGRQEVVPHPTQGPVHALRKAGNHGWHPGGRYRASGFVEGGVHSALASAYYRFGNH